MGLLDLLPHIATAAPRARQPKSGADGSLGGADDTFAGTALFTARPCWQQAATDREINEFGKRGIVVTNKVYFTTRPAIDQSHILTITNNDTGQTDIYEVRSRAEPDASAGRGILYRVMCELTTTGSTP